MALGEMLPWDTPGLRSYPFAVTGAGPRPQRNGADYSVYINTAQEFDGSDSGARPDEAVSWGKIRMDAQPVKVRGVGHPGAAGLDLPGTGACGHEAGIGMPWGAGSPGTEAH